MRKVNVAFDSSGLYPNTNAIVCSEFEDFFKEFSDKCDLKIYIPKVVKGELCYQKVSKADENLKKAKELLINIGKTVERQRKAPFKKEELRPLVEKKFDKWAKHKNIILLETPWNKISLKELQEKSIWRIPPFEDLKRSLEPCKKCRAEKGFRDALILFSVLELAKKITNSKVYFICGDKLLLESVEKYKTNKRLIPFKTIEELSSRLRLSFEEDNEKWINRISEKAREVFYRRAWEKCKVEEEIRTRHVERFEIPSTSEFGYLGSASQYSQHIQSPEITSNRPMDFYGHSLFEAPSGHSIAFGLGETKCVPLDEGRFYIDNPSFQKVEDNNIYIWESRVSHRRKYKEPGSIGIVLPKVYKIYFDVTWSARVTKDERFYNLKLLDVEFIDKEFDLSLSLD